MAWVKLLILRAPGEVPGIRKRLLWCVSETQRLNSLLRTHFGSLIIEEFISPEGVKRVSENAYSKLSSAMKGVKEHPAKETLKEEPHVSLYEFITNLKNDPCSSSTRRPLKRTTMRAIKCGA